MPKTIKEIAEEFGVTPQTVRNFCKTLSQNFYKKVGKKIVLTDKGEKIVIAHFEARLQKKNSKNFAKTGFMNGKISIPEDFDKMGLDEIQELKNKIEMLELEKRLNSKNSKEQIEMLASQLNDKDNQISHLSKLLDQEQQLHLNAQKENQLLLESSDISNWSFWERLKGKKNE